MSAFTIVPVDPTICREVMNGSDTLWFFMGEPALKTSDESMVDWYRTTDTVTPFQTSIDEVYLDSVDYVMVKHGGEWIKRYVVNYLKVRPQIDSICVYYHCKSTDIEIPTTANNRLDTVVYYTDLYSRKSYHFAGTLTYNDLEWTNQWDSVNITKTLSLKRGVTMNIDAVLSDKPKMAFSSDTVADLFAEPQQWATVFEHNEPRAISFHATSVTTIRTELNEMNRPETDDVVDGSAPLNILFKMNPTPNVRFYQWRIYRGSTFIVQRTDENTRYEFLEDGTYRIVGTVSNEYCPCEEEPCERDSMELKVQVRSSDLRVPNVFTPNGDGVNDEFRVAHRSLKEFHCEIYNRWGKLVYQWDDPNKGWDGTINGKPAAEGAYFYVIRALGTDANDDYMSHAAYKKAKNNGDIIGVYQLAGDINLIRGK